MFLERTLELIERDKISKNKLLMDLGLGKNSFVNWSERGTVPSAETIEKIADYFGVTTDYLLGRTDIMNEDDLKAARQFTADTFKTMLSAEGVRVIKTYLTEYMNNADEEVWEELKNNGLSLADIKAALMSDNMLDNKLFSKLDKVFSVTGINFYDIFKEYFINNKNNISLADYGDIAAEGGEINHAKTTKAAVTSIDTDD